MTVHCTEMTNAFGPAPWYTGPGMKTNGQTKEDHILLAQMEDKQRQAEEKYMIASGDFLDAHQRKLAEDYCRHCGCRRLEAKDLSSADGKQNGSDPNGVAGAPKNATAGAAGIVFYGGYDEAERCMPVFLPDYATLPGYNVKAELEELLAVIRVSVPGRRAVQSSSSGRPGGRSLTHRDYLGSLLALGIRREMTGDILVRDGTSELGPGADIIVKAEIADFIISNYDKAGRTQLQTEVLPISQLHLEPVRLEHHRDTVASLRLDSVVSSAFRLSRAKAAEAIRRGLVSVNSIETMKIDASVSEGDKVVLRGQGKALLSEVGATTRKDRIRITIARYV